LPRLRLALLLAVAGIAWPLPAIAQPSPADAAAAQAAYDQGKQLMSDGKYADACPRLEESQRLDPGAGTQFHLADCWEHVGRTASAWAAFIEVATASKAAGRADRERISRERAAALAPRLSRLTIAVAAKDTPGLKVQRDGEAVGSGLWDTPIPVDLGTHAITATAKGKQPWQGKVEITTEGAGTTITVPALLDAPAEGTSTLAGGASESAGAGGAPGEDQQKGSTQRTIGLVAGAAGLVAMGVAIPIALAAKSKFNDAQSQCVGGCTPQGEQTDSSAISMGNTATVVLVGGAVVTAAGVIVWLTAPHAGAPKAAFAGAPRLGVTTTGTGLLLHGEFQ
jgi:serine/threonine-protein kinase